MDGEKQKQNWKDDLTKETHVWKNDHLGGWGGINIPGPQMTMRSWSHVVEISSISWFSHRWASHVDTGRVDQPLFLPHKILKALSIKEVVGSWSLLSDPRQRGWTDP